MMLLAILQHTTINAAGVVLVMLKAIQFAIFGMYILLQVSRSSQKKMLCFLLTTINVLNFV